VVRSRTPATRDNRGATLVEYALLLGLIALVCMSAVAFFGSATNTRMSRNASALQGAGP
jgi:Flp pilus assembly pilin Flp